MTDAEKGLIFTERRRTEAGVVAALSFWVWGHPEPAGSKRALPRKGAPGKFVVVDDNPKSAGWKALVGRVGDHALRESGGARLAGPVAVAVSFYRRRPNGHHHTSGKVRKDAPAFPITKPDTLKLMRAVEDALTGVLYEDDAQIVEQFVTKEFAAQEGVRIVVWSKPLPDGFSG